LSTTATRAFAACSADRSPKQAIMVAISRPAFLAFKGRQPFIQILNLAFVAFKDWQYIRIANLRFGIPPVF
jgi:hypothetical protein